MASDTTTFTSKASAHLMAEPSRCNHALGLALAAVRQGNLNGARDIIESEPNHPVTIEDVFGVYQIELETQNIELKEANARTEATLNWFAQLFRQLPVAAIFLSESGRIIDANEKAVDMLELASRKNEGATQLRRFLTTSDAEMRISATMKRVSVGGAESLEDVTLRTCSGRIYWADLRMTTFPNRDLSSAPVYLCIINDRTAQVEAQLAHEKAVRAEMQRDLANTANESKSQLMARVSHEFRTPLNAVIGLSDLMLSQPQRLAVEERIRFIQLIRDAGEHLLELVDDVLQINRTQSTLADIPVSRVNVSDVIQDTISMISPLAAQRNIEVSIDDWGGPAIVVRARPLHLREVLINLLSNAIKYNREGGWISVTLATNRHLAWVTVTDSGQGMTEDQLQHIFEPFNRLGAEYGTQKGLGLGLYITRTLVESMQGKIEVSSTPAYGTSFKVCLTCWSDVSSAG